MLLQKEASFKMNVPELLEAYQKASAGHEYGNYGFEEKEFLQTYLS